MTNSAASRSTELRLISTRPNYSHFKRTQLSGCVFLCAPPPVRISHTCRYRSSSCPSLSVSSSGTAPFSLTVILVPERSFCSVILGHSFVFRHPQALSSFVILGRHEMPDPRIQKNNTALLWILGSGTTSRPRMTFLSYYHPHAKTLSLLTVILGHGALLPNRHPRARALFLFCHPRARRPFP